MTIYHFNDHASVASSDKSSYASYGDNSLLKIKWFAITYKVVGTNHA